MRIRSCQVSQQTICLVASWCLWLGSGIGSAAEPAATPPATTASDPNLKVVLTWGEKGSEPGQFHSPIAIACDAADRLYVTEFRNNRVQWFQADGKFLGQIKVAEMPGGLAVDPQRDEIYVAPMLQHKICVYDRQGQLLREWGKKGTGPGEFDQPGGMVLTSKDVLYVTDQVNRRIQYFSREGKFLGEWGSYGTAPGQFDGLENRANRTGGPNFIAVDRAGNLWTTEARPGRIQQFSPEGKPLFAFGSNSTERGGFGGRAANLPGPIAITVDALDRLWITATNHRVQAFNPNGEFQMGFESLEPGHEPGEFETPHGVVFDSRGYLYVVDAQNQRIQKIHVPGVTQP